MANKIDLATYDSGYWGYLSEDVKYTISSVTSAIAVINQPVPMINIGLGGIQVLGDVAAAGTLSVLSMINATDDSDAASKGVDIDALYHTNGAVKIRLT